MASRSGKRLFLQCILHKNSRPINMVFFVCEGCNETLKKNQVDKHAHTCRNCYAVTCVDCSVTFYENDYAAHTTCISEAEKYEKSLYKAKPGANKPKAQDIWTALIEDIAAESSQAPPSVRPFLERLSTLSNVPRNKKKFINFSRNSLNIRSDSVLEDMWNFLEKVREQKEKQSASTETVTSSPDVTPASQILVESEDSKKKDKKRKHDEDEEIAVETSTKKTKFEESGDVDGDKKQKKDKKDKKDKKHKKNSK